MELEFFVPVAVSSEARDIDPDKNVVIPSFRRKVDENCTLLGDYAASSVIFLPTFTRCVITLKSTVLENVLGDNFKIAPGKIDASVKKNSNFEVIHLVVYIMTIKTNTLFWNAALYYSNK
jgi:hypothetical protein